MILHSGVEDLPVYFFLLIFPQTLNMMNYIHITDLPILNIKMCLITNSKHFHKHSCIHLT